MSDSSSDEGESVPAQSVVEQGDDITFQKLVSILSVLSDIFLFAETKTLFDSTFVLPFFLWCSLKVNTAIKVACEIYSQWLSMEIKSLFE